MQKQNWIDAQMKASKSESLPKDKRIHLATKNFFHEK